MSCAETGRLSARWFSSVSELMDCRDQDTAFRDAWQKFTREYIKEPHRQKRLLKALLENSEHPLEVVVVYDESVVPHAIIAAFIFIQEKDKLVLPMKDGSCVLPRKIAVLKDVLDVALSEATIGLIKHIDASVRTMEVRFNGEAPCRIAKMLRHHCFDTSRDADIWSRGRDEPVKVMKLCA